MLDPLGNRDDPERVGEAKDRLDEARVGLLPRERIDERLRDLQKLDRELREAAQRRVARTEVVDRERDTEVAETLHRLHPVVLVPHDAALGDLDRELPRIEPGAREGDREILDEPLVRELAGREVDPEADVPGGGNRLLPLPHLAKRLPHDRCAEFDDEAALLRDPEELFRAE